jgi:hypothetical protein
VRIIDLQLFSGGRDEDDQQLRGSVALVFSVVRWWAPSGSAQFSPWWNTRVG